jgi:hypothetical protein
MSAYYCVIQYVPDPGKDERINAGVVAFSGDQVRAQFVRDWWRVQRFGDRSISFLKDLARQLKEAENGTGDFTEAVIRTMAGKWMNSVQFSEPRGSLLNLEDLLDDASQRFLHEPRPPKARPRDRRAAAKLAAKAISDALETLGGKEARGLLKRNKSIPGRIEEHKFDVAVGNGRPTFAADAFSFEGSDLEGVAIDVRAAAWGFEDVRKKSPDLDLAVVFLAPDLENNEVTSATRIFDDLGADVVLEADIPDWADSIAEMAVHAG